METRILTLLVIYLGYTTAQFVNLSSSVEQSGRSHACPDESVTYTCETNGTTLTWFVDPYVTRNNAHTFSRITNEKLIAAIPEAVRLLVSNSSTLLSTMVLRPSGNVENTTVVCLTSNDISRSLPYRMSGLPSPPQNVMVTIVQNGTTNVTVNIDWDPPVNNGGGAVDNYTVETSPETDTVRVTSGTTSRLDLFYNERYVVSVTAVNCAGSSTPAMTDPVEFINCSTPSTNPNVTFDPYQSTTEGSMIFYQCRPGLIPEGRVMSVCGVNGSWVPDPDQYDCRQVNCGAPRLPVNSSVLSVPSNGARNGSEVTFQCNDGLLPSNEITVVCTSEERWSPDPEGIVCGEEPVSCSRPNAPRNGFLEEVTSTTIMLVCNEGYSPQGTLTAECVAPDIWSPDPAQLECTSTTTNVTTDGDSGASTEMSNTGAIAAGVVIGVVVVSCLIVILIVVLVVVIMKKRSYASKHDSSMELQTRISSNIAGSPEGTLNGEYSKLQHPEGEGYSVLQHPGPHGNKSSSDHLGGLVYAEVGNFDRSKKRGFEISTASELDDKVQYSALTHKPAPPPEIAAMDKLLNLDSLAIQLKEVSSLWYELGEQLGITRETLNDIESHYTDVEDRRIEMFAFYLRTEPHPTWSQVAKALSKLHENTLAEQLENSYVTGQLPIQVNMDAVPSSSYKHSKAPPPPLPPKSSDFDDSIDPSSPAPLILPPKPPRHGDTSSTSRKRPPPPVPQFDDEPAMMVAPPRPPKSGEPAQPPLPPKPKNL